MSDNGRINIKIIAGATGAFILGLLSDIASSALPPQIEKFAWLAWPILILVFVGWVIYLIIPKKHTESSRELKGSEQLPLATPQPLPQLYAEVQKQEFENSKSARNLNPGLEWEGLRTTLHDLSINNLSGPNIRLFSRLKVPRPATQRALHDFLNSDKACFVLVGKSGIGKTYLMLMTEDEIWKQHPDQAVLIYDGAEIDPRVPLRQTLYQDCKVAFSANQYFDWIYEISRIPGMEQRQVILCIDSIHKNPQPALLLKQIDDLVSRSKNIPWLKIIITARAETWSSIRREIDLKDDNYYEPVSPEPGSQEFSFSAELGIFEPDEAELAYESHQRVFSLQDSVLSAETKQVLRNPAILFMEAEMQRGDVIKPRLHLRSVVRDYIQFLTNPEKVKDPLGEEDIRFLIDELIPLMVSEKGVTSSISAARLLEADRQRAEGSKLSVLIKGRKENKNDPAYQKFLHLVDAEILVTRGKDENFEISFGYERYWDHFVAIYFFETLMKLTGERKRANAIGEFARMAQAQPILYGPMMSLYFLLLEAKEEQLLVQVARNSNQECQNMVASALIDYYRINPELVRSILENWRKLWRQRLLAVGEEQQALVAVEVAGEVGDHEILLAALCSRNPQVQNRAVVSTYKFWVRDPDRGQITFSQLVKKIELLPLIVRPQALNSAISLSLLIYFNHYDDKKRQGEVVLETWRPQLQKFMLYRPGENGESRFKKAVRGFLLTVLIYSVTIFLKSIPNRYNLMSMREIRTFFKLPPSVKGLGLRITKYLEPGRKDLDGLGRELDELFWLKVNGKLLNNMFFKLLTDYVLVAQGLEPDNLRPTLNLVSKYFDLELARPGSQKRILWDKTWVFSALSFLMEEIDDEMFAKQIAYTQHCHNEVEVWEGDTGYYAFLGYADFARIHHKKHQKDERRYKVTSLQDLVETSLQRKEYQKVLDILEEMGYLAGSDYYEITLFVIQPVLRRLDDGSQAGSEGGDFARIREKTIEILAVIHTRHPDEIRWRLHEEHLPAELIEQIEVRRVDERVAGGLLKGGLGTWGQFELAKGFSPAGRPYLQRIFQTACRCTRLNQFLLKVAGSAINLVLAAPVFSITLDEIED